MINVGDIVKTSYDTGPYRVLSVSGPWTHPSFHDEVIRGLYDKAPPSKPHYSMVVVPVDITVGQERQTDHCYLNGYEPTDAPDIWRSVWGGVYHGHEWGFDELYILGHSTYVQLEMFGGVA